MKTTISKWGNSLAVRIPVHIAEELKLSSGNDVLFKVEDNKLVISRTAKRPVSLKDLVKGFNKKNIKDREDFWGKPVGKEIW